MLQQVGLEGLEHKKVNHLSGGRDSRWQLQALAMDAEVIADEPTGALDLSDTESLMDAGTTWINEITVIIVTHDRYVAMVLRWDM